MNEKIVQELHTFIPYQHIICVKRANVAIDHSLKLAKQLGYTTVCIPDQGGWLTYEQFARRLKLDVLFLKTDNGVIITDGLCFQPHCILLLHSLSGYHSMQPTQELAQICKRDNALFIEDICGCFGGAVFGDIVLCSFGNGKPINYGKGGFVAFHNTEWLDFFTKKAFDLEDNSLLLQKLQTRSNRYDFLFQKRDEVIALLKEKKLSYIADKHAICIIVPYSTDVQKEEIISLCDSCSVEYEECPRYIRYMDKAISIEIKRLTKE